jgi:hypothetical protein
MIKYIQIDGDEALKLGYPEAEGHTNTTWCLSDTCIYLEDNGKVVEFIGSDGGEPEDKTLYRDFDWVIKELNRAYYLGVRDGRAEFNPKK